MCFTGFVILHSFLFYAMVHLYGSLMLELYCTIGTMELRRLYLQAFITYVPFINSGYGKPSQIESSVLVEGK